MTKQRFLTCVGALALGLIGLIPSEAKATQVMCSNEYGHCDVQDIPSWITCSCNNESSTGGTGGNDYQGLSEAELMAVCEAELSYCTPGEETDSGTTTFGTSDTGNTDTGTSDTGDTFGTSSTSDSGTSDSGTSDSGTTGDSGTSGDSGTTSTSDSGGESGGESSTGNLTSDGGLDEAAESGDGDPPGNGEGEGCSVANDTGMGAFALFSLLGLLGLRSRKRS